MTVETAALSQQQLEQLTSVTVAAPAGRRPRKELIAFTVLVGVVELAWIVLLVEVASRLA